MSPELLVISIGAAGFAGFFAWMAVLVKRSGQRAWRRWQAQLATERCAMETAPIFCGRQIK
jgi:hypothetical protein